jgi:toxin ParE1/3/4
MALSLSISQTAQNDIADTADFLAGESARAAVAFVEKIEKSLEILCERPNIGPQVLLPPGTGLRKMSSPPYIIFYRTNETKLTVVRVLHSARDIQAQDLRA